MSVSTNDLKNGMTLELDGTLFQIVEFQHVKPGKGGAFVRTKLRNVRTGAVVDKTFNAGVKVGLAIVERKEMQYLYPDGPDLVFMDLQTYEQLHVPGTRGGRGGSIRHGGWPGDGRHPSRGPDLGRPSRLDGPVGHEHGSGRERGHAHERAQAGDARDRSGRPGTSLRRRGRSGEGRHTLGRIHRAREGVTSAP